jgi:hypothetical protein
MTTTFWRSHGESFQKVQIRSPPGVPILLGGSFILVLDKTKPLEREKRERR